MSFPLIGNEKIRLAVDAALSSSRLPHAIILEGEAGLGRHTLAHYLAAAAVCEGESKPCGECRSCHLAKTENHPDITVTAPEDKKKNISVGQIRELRQKAFVKPHLGTHRIFIIDRAETMNEQAQNALLKILEEPPGGVIFLLICESAAAMLDTVLSRCVTFTLSAPDTAEACSYIRSGFKLKKDDAEIKKAVEDAKGNIGRALEILSKKSASPAEAAAKEFSALIFTGSEYELLCRLTRFEKDRPAADIFISSFKYEIAAMLKENYKEPQKAKVLTALYSLTDDFSAALKTNINLSLLFTDIVSTVQKLRRDYLN